MGSNQRLNRLHSVGIYLDGNRPLKDFHAYHNAGDSLESYDSAADSGERAALHLHH